MGLAFRKPILDLAAGEVALLRSLLRRTLIHLLRVSTLVLAGGMGATRQQRSGKVGLIYTETSNKSSIAQLIFVLDELQPAV